MTDQPTILFDGICNLCTASVRFIIKHDPTAIFKFSSLQSETGKNLLSKYNFSSPGLDSFILIQNNVIYSRSTAALIVAKQLKGAIKLLYGFIIVPPFIRNGVYKFIARNRYKWFGKKESCLVPSSDMQARFLN